MSLEFSGHYIGVLCSYFWGKRGFWVALVKKSAKGGIFFGYLFTVVEVVFEVVQTAFEEDEAVLFSVGHDIRSCAAEKLLKLVNWAGDDVVVVCG